MDFVYANKVGRRSFPHKLARLLGIHTLGADKIPPKDARLLNWGCSQNPAGGRDVTWIGNTPQSVAKTSNKVSCFQALAEADIPTIDWTTDKAKAQAWLDAGRTVYERHVINGHSGAGIVMKRPNVDKVIDEARLYTRRVAAKFNEYRVHVVNGQVIVIQQKRRMSDGALERAGFKIEEDWLRNGVRTYKNGWVFATNDVIKPPQSLLDHSIQAIAAVGAVTGAVDAAVIEGDHDYIIEINSAPALRSFTVCGAYKKALQQLRGIR